MAKAKNQQSPFRRGKPASEKAKANQAAFDKGLFLTHKRCKHFWVHGPPMFLKCVLCGELQSEHDMLVDNEK